MLLPAGARAQQAPASPNVPQNLDLGSVLTQGAAGGADDATTQGSASYEAPSRPPLNSLQPTSVVNQNTIQKQLTGSQSYEDALKLTPSVSGIDPNGPGLMETTGLSIRGLQDGQFNVTFDGIPIGDSNDFTHHTTSFFMAHDLGQVIVDRGPGTAETVGDATFGGTVSVRTKDPLSQPTFEPYGEYGSFNTSLGGGEFDSGAISWLNGASLILDAEHLSSDGALSYATQERTNLFAKLVAPLSASTTLTGVAMFNRVYQNPPIGATAEEIHLYGSDFAYTNNPQLQNYNRYNDDHITTDMEYLDLTSALGAGFLYDGKVYTYGYYHHDLNGDDPNGQGIPGALTTSQIIANGEVPNEAVVNGVLRAGDVPGENFDNSYRSYGTIQRMEKDFRIFGMRSDIKTGAWYDHQINTRALSEVDISDGNAPNTDPHDANGGVVQDRLQHNTLDTFQPFGQLDIHPIPDLLLTGGLKYAFFRRQIDAPINQGTEDALKYAHNYTALLPSGEARYKLTHDLSIYGQVAKGFLAPNLNYYYTNNAATDGLQPQETWNYQTGFVFQNRHVSLGGDAYLIDWQNYVTSEGKGANKVFYNQGGVFFKGLEAEITYSFDNGISLFSNAGLNDAYYRGTHAYVPEVPQFTANFGIIYDKHDIYASLIDQVTGGEFDSNGTPTGANPREPGAWYDPYNLVNITLGYTFQKMIPHVPKLAVKLNIDNVTDQTRIFWSPGTTLGGQPLYFTLPGISTFVSVSVPLAL
ncbi:TonB-dependent receptor [Lichenicoccus sp.]|uniref:TonB-dependent receptor n=1 Tax=Lichenicoccus sp. TaxID=2781899 RepID=UPI003D0EE6A7